MKWWGGWGRSDDINALISCLLEVTSKYESSYTQLDYRKGSESMHFNSNICTFQDMALEMGALHITVVQLLSACEQSAAVNRFLVATELDETSNKFLDLVSKRLNQFKDFILSHIQGNQSIPSNANSYAADTNAAAINNCKNDGYQCIIPHYVTCREVISHWYLGCPEKNLDTPEDVIALPKQHAEDFIDIL